eukprot:TRINITY_DN6596_c0_g1_i1.p1 TRINITY_DN6596_c0_g1~~TRINITY_DN6596_c0_g1_i1.p1  ORF type:complete len:227 (-),score=28.10 TRINITY_DN6596_c0_g1_i1:279-959(-)
MGASASRNHSDEVNRARSKRRPHSAKALNGTYGCYTPEAMDALDKLKKSRIQAEMKSRIQVKDIFSDSSSEEDSPRKKEGTSAPTASEISQHVADSTDSDAELPTLMVSRTASTRQRLVRALSARSRFAQAQSDCSDAEPQRRLSFVDDLMMGRSGSIRERVVQSFSACSCYRYPTNNTEQPHENPAEDTAETSAIGVRTAASRFHARQKSSRRPPPPKRSTKHGH